MTTHDLAAQEENVINPMFNWNKKSVYDNSVEGMQWVSTYDSNYGANIAAGTKVTDLKFLYNDTASWVNFSRSYILCNATIQTSTASTAPSTHAFSGITISASALTYALMMISKCYLYVNNNLVESVERDFQEVANIESLTGQGKSYNFAAGSMMNDYHAVDPTYSLFTGGAVATLV